VHQLARNRLKALSGRRPLHVLTSVGRIVTQKMRLLFEKTASGKTALEEVLSKLGDRGVFFLLGSGEHCYEDQLSAIAANHSNFVFLRGYSEALGDALYRSGNLFLMPSSFEPCGISQMRAMRDSQPCVVHGVGGLRDTVIDNVTGFVFAGNSPASQATQFVATVERALKMRENDPLDWQRLCDRAAAERFDWKTSAQQYIEQLYVES